MSFLLDFPTAMQNLAASQSRGTLRLSVIVGHIGAIHNTLPTRIHQYSIKDGLYVGAH